MNDRQPLILLVDPDVDSSLALSALLDRKGFHVVRRSFGSDALEFVSEEKPDLVLTERNLKDIDSLELLAAIKTVSPVTRVVFMKTQDPRESDPGDVPGGDGVLFKPLDSREVLRTIGRLLERVHS